MAYVKLNLTDGTVFEAKHVKHIEDGIKDAETVGEAAVLYTEQALTEEQQAQARANIRCGSVGSTSGVVASGEYSHCEGEETQATALASHAEGHGSKALSNYSHAEGSNSKASGYVSHAEGCATYAEGRYSHSEGYLTIAQADCQHTQGKCNVKDIENKYAHIVGNGASDAERSNAHTIDWEGNAWFAGDIYVGGTGQDDEAAVKFTPEDWVFTLEDGSTVTKKVVIAE